MNISIIIPNYNGKHLLKQNIPRVLAVINDHQKKMHEQVELILVDDGSKDDSVAFIESSLEEWQKVGKVRFIKQSKNLGFSSTVNHGVREAEGEIVMLLNSDVLPDKGFLTPLLSHFEDETIFAVGCMDKSIEREKIVLRGRGIGKWERGFLNHRAGSVDKTTTLWVSGGSGAFRKSYWDKLQGLNELLNPFYWEDIDLSYRAQKAGYTILFEPQSTVVHEHEKGAIKATRTKADITAIVYRNQFIFTWTNMTDMKLIYAHLLWLPYHFLKAGSRKDKGFFKGFIKAFFMLTKILRYREKVQKLIVLSDRQIIERLGE